MKVGRDLLIDDLPKAEDGGLNFGASGRSLTEFGLVPMVCGGLRKVGVGFDS